MNVFTVFAQELAGALDPLRIGIEDSSALARVLETVGTRPDAVGAAGLLPALTAARDAIAAVAAMDSAPATLASVRTTLAAVRTTLDALRVARTAEATPFVDLGRDVLAVLAARHVRLRASRAYHVAVALGLINHRSIPGAEGARWPADVVQFDTGQLAALVTTPVAALRSLLPSDLLATRASANETSDRVVTRSAGLLRSLALPWRYGVRADDAEWVGAMLPHVEHMLLVKLPYKLVGDDEIGVCLSLSPADEDDLGVVVKPFGGLVLERQLLDWVVSIALNADVQAFAFGGGQGFQLLATPSTTEVRATFLAARATDAPLVIGGSSGTRLELDGLRFHGEANLSAALRTIDLGFEVERGLFVVTSDGGDGFLRRVVGTRELRVPFDFGVSYTTGRGLRFKGGAGFAVRLPGGVSVGPLTVGEVSIALEVSAEALRLVASASVRLALGPVDVRIEDVGTQLVAVFPAESLARDFDVDFDVQPPDGAAFAIDAGPVRGGGYLRHAAGRYAGALALDALGISLSAFGLLDATGPGYSLVATIGASFPAVPLPLGFTLDGVGGLIAIHRRVDTDALRASLRTPAGMGDIFFPADPVAQAERVTTDLATYFPAAEGRHVFGPAVKFGWGTPTMIRGELAVLLELPAPARVVLLGTVSAKLPTVDQAIVDLNVDVVGEVDFAQKRVAIDASLRNSTIAGFPITGDMAFRMAWGSPPSFALAIGGFHSHFPTPPGFPELRRVQIPLGAGDAPRLDAQGFLALTSNTAQIGAQIDLYASAGPLNIKGWLGFETLLTFSPFQLQVDVWAGVALRRGTSTLASIHFDGHLSGPKPWRLDGKACLSLWFVDLCVPIHVSFGAGTAAVLPSRQIWPALHEALATPAAWASTVPPGLAAAVTAPASGEAPTSRLEPCATLTVTQKVVPLDRQITAFAHGRPDGVDRFQVTGVRFGAAAVPAQEIAPVTEWFAPAQFEEMSEADKLSRPGFEQMVGGVSIGAATIRAGAPLVRALDYDTVVIVDGQRQEPPRYRPTRDLQLEGTLAAASARPPLRATGPAAFAPPPGRPPRLRLVEETFVIASTDALAPRWDLAAAGTRGQVELALRAHLAAHPGDAGRLQVVPTFEVAA